MSPAFRCLSCCALALALFGCASAEDYLSSVNPFRHREERLPGERRAVLADEPLQAPAAARPILVPAPVAVSNWQNPGGPASNAPVNAMLVSSKPAWKTGDDSGLRASAPPIVTSGFVFLYDGRRVSTFNLNDGSTAWSTGIAPKNAKAPTPGGGIATDGRAIYVASSLRVLTALDIRSGERLWTKDLPDPARSAPTVAGGHIYVISATGVVSAYATEDGRELWRYASPANAAGLFTALSPAVQDNLVAVPFSSGELVGLDANSGAVLWSGTLLSSQRVSAVSSLGDLAGRPAIGNGMVYAGGAGGRFVAVRASSGEKIWEQTIASAFGPVIAGDGVFVLAMTGDVYAFDHMNGEVRWSAALPKGEGRTVWAGPVLANSQLWFVSNQGTLAALDAASGTIVSQQTLPEGSALAPITANGKLLIATIGGGLIALQ